MPITRRDALGAIAAVGTLRAAKEPVILLRSGWQTVNIGDIAHTPGVLTVIERNIPDARVILWPGRDLDLGAEPMLRRRFPRLTVLPASSSIETAELRDAFRAADLLLHGSAAGVGSLPQFAAWRRETKKPYGYFGVGFSPGGEAASPRLPSELATALKEAKFVFTRETASLANLKKAGIDEPETGFAPDGAFSMDLLDDAKAKAFLEENKLQPKRFIAVVPRLRYTPYHKFRKVEWTPAEIQKREETNAAHGEADHAKLREVITAWVRETGLRVLLCPEMTYEIDIIDPLLYNPLPADVKARTVRRKRFWLPDEAASIYRDAVAVISFECHSPIIAAGQGTPCMYIHQPEDGIKGHMWKDIGLGDWYFEVSDATGAAISRRLLEIHGNYPAAVQKVRKAVAYARELQDKAMLRVRKVLEAG